MTRKHTTTVPAKNRIRCAIYTRKSSEEGLEQDFNSLDARREAAEAYVASQKSEGWECLSGRYDDGGFTGGNMDRPALAHLLADIEAGKVDCVVVYKVDRLSRSLMDFARIVEVFERRPGSHHQTALRILSVTGGFLQAQTSRALSGRREAWADQTGLLQRAPGPAPA